eukprot:08336.XXX_198976_201002_1 [CDS] Oithona nana genome sequencing.
MCLRGMDVLGAAKTGSGKTLAFLIPLIEKLYTLKWTPLDGLGALVITPTRELAYQIFETLRKVGKYHDFSAGLVIGGKDLKYESSRLQSCNIIICTPGRLLHHMDENPNFDATSLKLLVLDEADRCMDMGFEKSMNAIIENLPTEDRQTLLFSATQTRSVKDLARLSLDKPVYVSVHEHSDTATPDKLAQRYVVCELKDKVNLVWSFIKNHKRKKLLIFMQSCKQVKFIHELFKRLKVSTTILALHGKLHQLRRMAIYDEFCQKDSSVVLLATDIAARGLDFPKVDWVLQADCPEDAKTYLHRVGRTARHSSIGQSLLILLPSEQEGMLKQLRIHRIPIDAIQVDPRKVNDIQRKIQAHVAADPELKASAQRAFLAYIKSTFLLSNKEVFDVHQLDTEQFSRSLGLAVTPRIRFLQRLEKKQSDQSKPKSASLFDSDNDEEDNVLTLKRKNHDIPQAEEHEEVEIERLAELRSKVVTKAAIAKKLLKKKILPNQKITFGEEGQVQDVAGVTFKKSQLGQSYDLDEDGDGGIDIDRAREILKAEDKFDKELNKEKRKAKKREEKEKAKEKNKRNGESVVTLDANSSDSDDGALDWLPDPDKLYGKSNEDAETDEDREESPPLKKKKWKAPKKPRKQEEEKPNLEDLALKLLKQ